MIDKAQKPGYSECHTPLSETFRFYREFGKSNKKNGDILTEFDVLEVK
jgi:hypothetical protein